MSSTAEPQGDRKLLKPLMEKRRRDRMNRSLDRLRLLLLAATCDERLRSPKVEKAEILRKAVQFLRAQPLSEPVAMEELFLRHYQSGYQECLARATRFLLAIPAEPPSPTPSPMASCPAPLAASPTNTPRPLGHHGLPAGAGYHSSGPGYRSYGGPGLGPTHRPGCDLGYHHSGGSGCPSDGPSCPNCNSPTFRLSWGSSIGPQHGSGDGLGRSCDGPVCPHCGHSCPSNCPGCPCDGPSCPSNGPGCPHDDSSYNGSISRPSWGFTLGPQHGSHGGPSGSSSGHEDSQQCCTKEEVPEEDRGLPGPPHHVWRPWP